MIVSLDLIKPTQKYLKSESLDKIVAVRDLPPPLVRLVDDEYLVIDGHHRVAAVSLRGGETIDVIVLYSKDDLPENNLVQRRYDTLIQVRSLVLSRGIKTVKDMYGYWR